MLNGQLWLITQYFGNLTWTSAVSDAISGYLYKTNKDTKSLQYINFRGYRSHSILSNSQHCVIPLFSTVSHFKEPKPDIDDEMSFSDRIEVLRLSCLKITDPLNGWLLRSWTQLETTNSIYMRLEETGVHTSLSVNGSVGKIAVDYVAKSLLSWVTPWFLGCRCDCIGGLFRSLCLSVVCLSPALLVQNGTT